MTFQCKSCNSTRSGLVEYEIAPGRERGRELHQLVGGRHRASLLVARVRVARLSAEALLQSASNVLPNILFMPSTMAWRSKFSN